MKDDSETFVGFDVAKARHNSRESYSPPASAATLPLFETGPPGIVVHIPAETIRGVGPYRQPGRSPPGLAWPGS